MKTLMLLRHSKSSHAIAELDDILRPLNERGYQNAAVVAKEVEKVKDKPDQIITSPAIRAYTTALIFANQFKINNESIVIESKLYFTGTSTILKIIKSINNSNKRVLLVGHNPDFENILKEFTNNNFAVMTTSAMAILNFNVKSWHEVSAGNCQFIELISPATISAKATK